MILDLFVLTLANCQIKIFLSEAYTDVIEVNSSLIIIMNG